jgi:hypothetical protein
MAEFRRHFASINGSVEETAKQLKAIVKAVSDLTEEMRRDKQAVLVRAETLATETETRRVALADGVTLRARRQARVQPWMLWLATTLVLAGSAAIKQF